VSHKKVPVNDFIDASNEINYLHHRVAQLESAYTHSREDYQRLRQRLINTERKLEEARRDAAAGCRCPCAVPETSG
jgi:predicted  nucleic acid-binding Zn-ribbon protein